MEESSPKKMKKHVNHEIFRKFRRNKDLFRLLHATGECIDKGYSDMNACFLELDIADPPKCRSFSKAVCYTKHYPEGTAINIGSLFYCGMKILADYTSKPFQECLPDCETFSAALRKLLQFVSEEPSAEIYEVEKYQDEVSWAVVLAQHLFSKLSIGTHYNYTVDKGYSGKNNLKKGGEYCCACGKNEQLTGAFGDTSFGCSRGWHGSVDILVDEVPVSVWHRDTEEVDAVKDEDDESDTSSVPSDHSDSSTGFPSGGFSLDQNMKLVSQCIVYSFLQLKTDPSLNHYLIPLIGVCGKNVKILFYDSESDLLLRTAQLDLLDTSGKLCPKAVVLLWLVLNYRIFSTGVPVGFDQYRAKFPEFARDMMTHYREDVKYKIGVVVEEEENNRWAARQRNTPRTAFPQSLWQSESDSDYNSP